MDFKQVNEYTITFSSDEFDTFLSIIDSAYKKQQKIGFKKTFGKDESEMLEAIYNTFLGDEESNDTNE